MERKIKKQADGNLKNVMFAAEDQLHQYFQWYLSRWIFVVCRYNDLD
jgi:hypothetical protein